MSPSAPQSDRLALKWSHLPLRIKLMLPIVLLNGLAAVAMYCVISRAGNSQVESRLLNDAQLFAFNVRSAATSIDSYHDLDSFLQTIGNEPNLNFILIVDANDGRVVVSTDEHTGKFPESSLPFWSAVEGRLGSSPAIAQAPWLHFSEYQLQYVSPLIEAGPEAVCDRFFVVMALDTIKAKAEVRQYSFQLSVGLLMWLICLSSLIAYALQLIVTKRVDELVRATPRNISELLNYKDPLSGWDEISRLSRSISSAYRSLAGGFDRLQKFATQLENTGRLAHVGSWEARRSEGELSTWEVHCCDQAHAISGWPVGKRLDVRSFSEFFPVDAGALVRSSLESTFKHGHEIDMDLPLTTFDNRALWVRLTCRPTFVEGEVESISGALQDVTEATENLQSALRANRDQRLLVERAKASPWRFVLGSKEFIMDSRFVRRAFNRSGTTVHLSEFASRLHQQDQERFLADWEQFAKGGKWLQQELRLRHGDSSWVTLIISGQSVERGRTGEPTVLAGLLSEIKQKDAYTGNVPGTQTPCEQG